MRLVREQFHGSRAAPRAVTLPSRALSTLTPMKSLLQETLHSLRTDRNLQDALFCTACWLSFAGAVVASVALPA